MVKEITVGIDMFGVVEPAECCENCIHCITDNQMDDPIGYYCNRDGSKPKFEDPKSYLDMSDEVRLQMEQYDQWLNSNFVRAGMKCREFKKADVVIKQYPIG